MEIPVWKWGQLQSLIISLHSLLSLLLSSGQTITTTKRKWFGLCSLSCGIIDMLVCKTDEVISGMEVEAWMLTNASFSLFGIFPFSSCSSIGCVPNGRPDVTLPRIRFTLIAIFMVELLPRWFDMQYSKLNFVNSWYESKLRHQFDDVIKSTQMMTS